jgi:glycine cleavage system regulatory protein
MQTQWILTVLGPDRPGLVERLADMVREAGGNWNQSRFMQVHGQFAGLLAIDVPEANAEQLQKRMRGLEQECGLVCQAAHGIEAVPDGEVVTLECVGQDRPGIVLAISDVLKELGVNVESLETLVESAPMSGETLFHAHFGVRVPREIDLDQLEERLATLGDELMLDVRFA